MDDEYLIYGETLETLADAIRSVANDTTKRDPHEMAAYILTNLVKPTTRQAAKTYTPSTSNQTIPAGTFLTGAATITGEPNYVEGNIKKGTKMWNKTGTLSGIWGTPETLFNFTAVKSGSFTLTNLTSQYVVTHGLGITPKLLICYADGTPGTGNSSSRTFVGGICFQTSTDTTLSKNSPTTNGELMYCARTRSLTNGSYEYSSYEFATKHAIALSNRGTMLSDTASISSGSFMNFIANSSTFTIAAVGGALCTYKWLVMG